MILGRLKGLLGEQVALEPQLRGPGHQGEGVGQREDDEVVLLVGALDERATVVDVERHPRVLVRVVGVLLLADLGDARVDLHGVDVLGALAQRERDVGAGTGADDEDVVERVLADAVVRHEVLRVCGDLVGHLLEVLVRDTVDVDPGDLTLLGGLHLVVRRPRDV